MSQNEERRPQPGNSFWAEDGEDYEIAEVLTDLPNGQFKVVDDDGDEAVIVWDTENEQWIVVD